VNDDRMVRLRRKPSARVVEHASGVTAYPEPHAVPVLPPGWAPLEEGDEAAVLRACDEAADDCRLRLGSVWDPAGEYRVYCLEGDTWRGVFAATLFTAGRNSRLLSIAHAADDAARIAIEFVNWDLKASGAPWRLSLSAAG
jgi:hypothetical protein